MQPREALTGLIATSNLLTGPDGATIPADRVEVLRVRYVNIEKVSDGSSAKAPWPDRELFVHCGRWQAGAREAAKFQKCAVRTERWRFVDNQQLYDISVDPNETTDVSAAHPEVVRRLRRSYDQWWEAVKPLMVNEDLPRVKDQPLHIRYEKQLAEKGIPEWAPDALK